MWVWQFLEAVISKGEFTMKLKKLIIRVFHFSEPLQRGALAMCIHGHMFLTCKVKYFCIIFLTKKTQNYINFILHGIWVCSDS